jgi:hypothetical protein
LIVSPYIAQKREHAQQRTALAARVPGWGVDLDPRDRPAVPKENFDLTATGAHWTFPERQVPQYPREKSTEHAILTPVFGTSCPPRGLSGLIRRYAYRRYSEGRAAHWVLLIAADRVDVIENRVTGLLRGRPDNPYTEMGLAAEWKRHGIRSRFGRKRADLSHLPVDLLMFAGSTAAVVAGAVALGRALRPRERR